LFYQGWTSLQPSRPQGISDRRIIRLIQKWLKAGILEDGVVSVSEKGTGQDSVISPFLPTSTFTMPSSSGPHAVLDWGKASHEGPDRGDTL